MSTESLLTAAAVLDQLVGAGARQFFFAPGSRSAPFVYAAASRDGGDLATHVRLDERSAGFHALGAARATGAPAVVVTTSGTAVGNLLPAVMEADHAEVPLVLLTADRPPELRGTGANQTTRQPGIFSDHVRAAVDVVVEPGSGERETAAAVARAFESVVAALTGDRGTPPGPVHVNVALREPLQPPLGEGIQSRTAPDEGSRRSGSGPTPSFAVDVPSGAWAASKPPTRVARSVVLAGDGAGPAAAELAEFLGLPLFAEPSSNARYGPNAVGPYRLLLESELGAGIERVLLVGRPTLSRPVGRLLARPDVHTAAWQPRPVAWYDDGRRRETALRTSDEVLEFTGSGGADWLPAWQDLAARAEESLAAELSRRTVPGHLPGPVVAREVWRTAARHASVLVAGSSNPVRDLDLAAEPARGPLTVLANRGLAGIDGTIATAAGAALATGSPVRVLLGDLTFLHDAGSLLHLAAEHRPDLQLVVLDDRGGGIFSTLEHGALGEEPAWSATVERFFGTRPEVDLRALCASYGVPATAVSDLAGLRDALSAPVKGTSVILVAASRESLRDLHAALAGEIGKL